MADFVAGVGGVGVGGVIAPGLVLLVEEGFDFGAAGVEERAEDLAVGDLDDGVDGAEALGPGSAKELHEDGFGLVVEGVGGEDGVGVAGGDEGAEVVVADGAGGFFDGFVGAGDAVGNAGLVEGEGDVETGAEVGYELLVGVGFGAAKAVVDVDGREADAEGVAGSGVGGVEGEEEGDGVCAAGDGDAEAVAGVDLRAVEGKGHRIHVNACVLPDGPTARGATTSWWVYRSRGDELHGASRCSADDDSD